MFDKKAYAKVYNEKNKEQLKLKRKEKYQENREKYLKITRDYYWKNRSEIVVRRAKERRTEEFKNKNRQYRKKYYQDNIEKERERIYRWKERNKKKVDVHAFVMYAVKIGFISKPQKCSKCKENGKIQAHHEDYDKPLDVIWLCEMCHGKEHRKYR